MANLIPVDIALLSQWLDSSATQRLFAFLNSEHRRLLDKAINSRADVIAAKDALDRLAAIKQLSEAIRTGEFLAATNTNPVTDNAQRYE